MSLRGLRYAVSFHGGRVADAARAWPFRLRSPALAWSRPSLDGLDAAIRAGAGFLARRQRRDGSLRGFQLAPGASVQWVTAHTVLVAEGVGELDEVAARAARHLATVGPEDGGWGYNRRVGPDFDSTAQALLALRRFGHEPPAFVERWFLGGQLAGGGYPTYPSPPGGPAHGWQVAHPDTTQMAALCLRRLGYEAACARALAYLDTVDDGGPTPAYWWPGYGYGLWLDRLLDRPPPAADVLLRVLDEPPHAAPWLTFGLGAALGRVPRAAVETAVRRLLAQQLADGSWPCAPCLRVTRRSYRRAGPDAPGVLFADGWRVFSTVHAVAALAAARPHGATGSTASRPPTGPEAVDVEAVAEEETMGGGGGADGRGGLGQPLGRAALGHQEDPVGRDPVG